MYTTNLLQQSDSADVLEPTRGASRIGYREIGGDVPSTGERVTLLCLAVVFDEDAAATARYQEIVTTLAEVDGNGLATTRLSGFDADRFGNMSERADTLGALATLWVTGTGNGGEQRGSVLVAVDGPLIQLLALSQYVAEGQDRAPHLLEELGLAMATRQAELELEPWAATMSYLPLLQDVGSLLLDTSITFNRYDAPYSGS